MGSKKMLVISDTHGSLSALKTVMNWAKDRMPPNDTICDAVFLGDGASDLRPAADATGFYSNWKIVRGNNDYEPVIQDNAVFDFCDYRFYICHGHRHSLYGEYHTLISAGRSNDANIVMFGHTHVPLFKKEGGLLLVNPGSVGRPRSKIGPTFAVIECTNEQLKVKLYGISSGIKEIDNLVI